MVHYNQELTDKLNFSGKQIERLNRALRNSMDQNNELKGVLTKRDA